MFDMKKLRTLAILVAAIAATLWLADWYIQHGSGLQEAIDFGNTLDN